MTDDFVNVGQSFKTEVQRFLNDLARVNSHGQIILTAMDHQIEGDGSDVSHFTTLAASIGVSTVDAKFFYEQMQSGVVKINTDASVSGVKSAISQLLAVTGTV